MELGAVLPIAVSNLTPAGEYNGTPAAQNLHPTPSQSYPFSCFHPYVYNCQFVLGAL